MKSVHSPQSAFASLHSVSGSRLATPIARRPRAHRIALLLTACAASALAGCGGDATSGGSSSTHDAPVDDGGYVSAQPPSAAGLGQVTTVSARHTFALHHLHLGDETEPNSGAPLWPNLGYDLDHVDTTASSTNVCTLATDAVRATQADGPGGIDNSFGTQIIPLLSTVTPNPSAIQDTAIAAGQITMILDTTGLDESNTIQTATGLSGQIFGGAPFNQAPNAATALPTFTAADDWPLDPSFLAVNGASGPISTDVFTAPYITGGTFVGAVGSALTLTLVFPTGTIPLKIQQPIVTFVNDGAHAGSGILAGVIATQDLVEAAEAYAADRCASPWVTQDFVAAVGRAADILHDGTNRAGVPCDAISVGIGFDADEIGAPQVVGAPATYPAPSCGEDGGADDGGVANGG